MQTYARQGGTSSIFINDDGLRLLPVADRNERITFYAEQNIGWGARPSHSDEPDGFKRAGRFKKASNMNYGKIYVQFSSRTLLNMLCSSSLVIESGSSS